MHEPTILIVDDDEHSRNILSHLISRAGYETFAASDVAEGLENLAQKEPQIILIDIKKTADMQNLDMILTKGQVFCPEVIVMTGTLDLAAEAANRGSFSYLLKPYLSGQLLIQIRQAVKKRELVEKIRRLEEQLENRMQFARQQAETESSTKTEFIARIHSQFRSSFTIIIGCSVILLEELSGRLNEKQREYIKHILDNSRMLQNVVVNGSDSNNATSNKNGIFQKYIGDVPSKA